MGIALNRWYVVAQHLIWCNLRTGHMIHDCSLIVMHRRTCIWDLLGRFNSIIMQWWWYGVCRKKTCSPSDRIPCGVTIQRLLGFLYVWLLLSLLLMKCLYLSAWMMIYWTFIPLLLERFADLTTDYCKERIFLYCYVWHTRRSDALRMFLYCVVISCVYLSLMACGYTWFSWWQWSLSNSAHIRLIKAFT